MTPTGRDMARAREIAADYIAQMCPLRAWSERVRAGKEDDNMAVGLALAGILAERERCAAVADELGGDRYEQRNHDLSHKHGRTSAMIEAQHLRAKSIAAVIRSGTYPAADAIAAGPHEVER